MLYPIVITKVKTGYIIHAFGVPIIKSGKQLDFDRSKAGMRVKANYVPPTDTKPHIFKKAGDATHVAHFLGKYLLGRDYGDLTFSYTKLENIKGPSDKWWSRALRH
jgi:hypothetical protein